MPEPEPEAPPPDPAVAPPAITASQPSDVSEEYLVDVIESVRRDRAVLSRAKRLGFLRAGG
jgi:hypothetical protein